MKATLGIAAGGLLAVVALFVVDPLLASKQGAENYDIHLRHGVFDPHVSTPQLPFQLDSVRPSELYIVQFDGPVTDDYRNSVEALGAKIHKYIPNYSYVVRMGSDIRDQVQKLSHVRWVGNFDPFYKMDPTLTFQLNSSSIQSDIYNIVVVSQADKLSLIEKVSAIGGEVVNPVEGSILIEARLSKNQLMDVIQFDEVLWVDVRTEIELDIDKARIQGGVDAIEKLAPESFTGKGIRGHVLEGINKNHPDFVETEHRMAPIPIDDGGSSSHGQATYGIIFGSGAGNPLARGILPNAQGLYTSYNAVFRAPAGGKEKGSRYELVARLIRDHQVMFQTASWGYSRTRSYDSRSAEMDHMIFNLDIPITQSQSNAGNQNSRPQAWAKNIISVGALKHQDTADPSDDRWGRGGSIGPASDGRIKPDISAYYDHILTTSLSGYTPSFGGTSGATPIVAGFVGLIIEMWTDGLFGNELAKPKGSRFENRPHFTTVKALLINSAKQYEFSGLTHDRTRVHQGWGFPNAKGLYDARKKILVVNEESVLKLTQTDSYELEVAEGEAELKVTLVYADPEATISASLHRVNDLDLKVTAPDGTSYWGNHGLRANLYSQPGGEANKIDTVENVFVKAPMVGKWTVEVTAAEVNADGHLETADMDVDYALVASGVKK